MARTFPWKLVTVVGTTLGAVGLLTIADRSSRRRDTPRASRVALIGDSYAVGLGPELAKLMPDFRYEGHVGIGTAAWASRGEQCGDQGCGDWITNYRPDVAVVSLGVNDRDGPSSANYQAIVGKLHGMGVQRVIWIEPPTGVTTPTAEVRRIIRSLGVSVVPATSTQIGDDGLHPVSYGPWAQEITQRLEQTHA